MEGRQNRRGGRGETATVRCVECGTEYAKPTEGSIAYRNPGCPDCGNVGWLAASVPFTHPQRPRSGGGRRPSPLVQPS